MNKKTPTERIKDLRAQVRRLKKEKRLITKELAELKNISKSQKTTGTTKKHLMAQYTYEPIEKVYFKECAYLFNCR